MSRAIEFIETSIFTKQINEIASDDELKDLQKELIAKPNAGDLIVGTGGLRKVRMATASEVKVVELGLSILSPRKRLFTLFSHTQNQQRSASVQLRNLA